MTSKEALKRLSQETAPNTYMADFDKKECIDAIKADLELLDTLRNASADKVMFSVIVNHKDGKLDYSVPCSNLSRPEFDDVVTYAYYALRSMDDMIRRSTKEGRQYLEGMDK